MRARWFAVAVFSVGIIFNVSQSSVATCLRCGRIHSDCFITNFVLGVPVKNLGNRSIFGKDTDKSMMICFFLTHNVVSSSGADKSCCLKWEKNYNRTGSSLYQKTSAPTNNVGVTTDQGDESVCHLLILVSMDITEQCY